MIEVNKQLLFCFLHSMIKGVSVHWSGFSTGTWDWHVGRTAVGNNTTLLNTSVRVCKGLYNSTANSVGSVCAPDCGVEYAACEGGGTFT